MAGQDNFPKSAGDIDWHSESNYFARGGGLGSGLWIITGSATAFQDTGSIVVTAGSITREGTLLEIAYKTSTCPSAGDTGEHRFLVSGIAGNFNFTVGSDNQNTSVIFYQGIAHCDTAGVQIVLSKTSNAPQGTSSYSYYAAGSINPSGTFAIISQSRLLGTAGTAGWFRVYSNPLSYNY